MPLRSGSLPWTRKGSRQVKAGGCEKSNQRETDKQIAISLTVILIVGVFIIFIVRIGLLLYIVAQLQRHMTYARQTRQNTFHHGPRRPHSWSRLSEQIFRVDKWSLCRG